ncbi:hypothetical protein [Bacillus sp. S3]|uniref:hypothetical protein n=1 Tax=Bacillus sp. S3 TaxID=486398 RepID=UPI0016815A4A|nr:hypothetical protein [Bacillus sp. S3]
MKNSNIEKTLQNINLILVLTFGLLYQNVTYLLVGVVLSIVITMYFNVPQDNLEEGKG